MPAALYKLVVPAPDIRAELTSEEVRKAALPFRRGHSNGTPYEELVLDISGKLRKSVGPIKRDSKDVIDGIAMLVKMLTEDKSFREASAYINSEAGNSWLRQWLVPKIRVSTAATVDVATVRAPENPTIAVAEADREIAAPLQQVNMASDVFATPLEGLRVVSAPIGPATLEAPASPHALLPGSPRLSFAHSRTPSDVSADIGPERCPECRQFHPEAFMLAMAQWLVQHGVGLNEDRAHVGSSRRQPRRSHSRPSSSVGAVPGIPGSPRATVEHRRPASIERPSSARTPGAEFPAWIKAWLVVLSLVVIIIGIQVVLK